MDSHQRAAYKFAIPHPIFRIPDHSQPIKWTRSVNFLDYSVTKIAARRQIVEKRIKSDLFCRFL